MRYFCYNAYDNKAPVHLREYIETVSEDEIRKEYYPFWLKKLNEKFGSASAYTFEDCLNDWLCVHHAWESTNEVS